MLEKVTFTGVDEACWVRSLVELAEKYPWLEWGVLVGSQTGRGNPIFPPLHIVHSLKEVLPSDQISLHLCGVYARQAAGLHPRSPGLFALCNGFGRVQVNLHGDIDDSKRIDDPSRQDRIMGSLIDFAGSPHVAQLILQHREGWDTVPIYRDNIEYLFDLSEGSGQADFDKWPPPPASGKRVGYAGGIGPSTIHQALTFEDSHADAPMWFDMEARIRIHNHLDLTRVRSVCESITHFKPFAFNEF